MTRPRFEDLTCPHCGHRGSFHFDVVATAYVDASGPCVEGDYYCDEDFDCVCLACFHDARVGDFVAKAVLP